MTAQYFQWYRITKVEYIYQPLSNTFQEGGSSTNPSMIQMYKMMNRNGYMSVSSLVQLEAMGAKAHAFTKNKTIKYRPNNLVNMVYNNPADSSPTAVNKPGFGESTYKWIACQNYGSGGIADALKVPYYGHSVYFFQQNAPSNPQFVCNLQARITIEYKEPGIIATFPVATG